MAFTSPYSWKILLEKNPFNNNHEGLKMLLTKYGLYLLIKCSESFESLGFQGFKQINVFISSLE